MMRSSRRRTKESTAGGGNKNSICKPRAGRHWRSPKATAPEVGETIAPAQGLVEQIDRPEHLVPLLRAQWVYHLIRCEPKQALSIAEQMEKVGAAYNDVAARLQGAAQTR